MQVHFPQFTANLGNIASASQVRSIPKIRWQCDPSSYYTLLMLNPTPLGQDTDLCSENQLWRVGNIKDCDIDEGETLTEYVPGWTLKNAGLGRIVFVIFEHKFKVYFEEPFLRNV